MLSSFIDNSMVDMFPMKNGVNLEIQMVGEHGFDLFQIKRNKVGCRWIQSSNGGK